MEEAAAPQVTTRTAGARYGLIMSVISIVMFLGMSFANVDMSSGIGRWVSIPIVFVVLYLAQKYFMDNGDGFMTYGQGIGITWWFSLVSIVVYCAFFFAYISFIDGSFVETIKQQQIQQMQERGMSDEQIDQAMSISAMFMTPGMITIFAVVFGLIGNMVCGLILTIFTQKASQEPRI